MTDENDTPLTALGISLKEQVGRAPATEGHKMKCKITCTFYSRNSAGHIIRSEGYSESVAVAFCETHGWQFSDGQPVRAGDLCPIGKIEAALEAALEAIERAKR